MKTETIEITIYIKKLVKTTIINHTNRIDHYKEYKQHMHTQTQPAEQIIINHIKGSQSKL